MPRIVIEAVPQEQQRYDTLGDWYYDAEGNLIIRVTGADPMDQDEAFLIALHELVEAKLCLSAGITQGAVDAFDLAFTGEGEPGDSPDAPYQKQHRSAALAEHVVAFMLGLWDYGRVE